MSNIGSMAVQLTASAEGVQAGADKAASILDSAAGKMADTVKGKLLPRIEAGLAALPARISADFGGAMSAAQAKLASWSESLGNWLKTSNLGTAVRWGGGLSSFFGSTLPSLAKQGFSAIAGMAAGIGETLEKAFKDPVAFLNKTLIGGLAKFLSQIPMVGGLLALPFEAIQGTIDFALSSYKEGADRIKEMGAQAAKTGLSLGQFQVMGMALGGGEMAEKALFKFQQNLANAQLAAEGTRTDFDRLGLSGREVAALAAKDMPAAFGMVADKISGLKNSALQAKFAMDLFGKTGFAIMPALLKGSEGIKKIQGNIDKFGLGISDADFASVRAAGVAKKQLEMLKEGFNNQITIAVAPFLAEVADRLGQLPGGFKGLADTIVSTTRTMAENVAFFADSFGSWDTAFAAIGVGWDSLVAKIMAGLAEILDRLPTVTSSLGKLVASVVGYNQLLSMAPTLNALGLLPDVGSAGDGLRQAALDRAKDAEVNAIIVELENLTRGATTASDAVASFFDGVEKRRKKTADDLKGMDLWGALLPRAQALEDSLAGPLDKFRDKVAEIQALMRAPMFGDLFTGLGERGLAKALQELKSATGGGGARFSGAMEQGSREAYTATLAYQSQQRTIEQQIRDILAEQKQIQEEQVRVGREAAEALKRINLDLKGI